MESENERLTEERDLYKKQFNELEPRFFDLREENKELKAQIVELEKGNELLRNAKVVYETVDYCYEDLKKAEKRIAELETKNEVLCVELSRYTENCIEMKNGTLKQFAERLKEQIKAKVEFYNDEVFDYGYNGIREIDIDETLEEFLK